MFWQPTAAVGGAAQVTASGYRLTLMPDQPRVEMVGPYVPKGSEFSASFDVAVVSASAGVPYLMWQLHDGADVGALNPIVALECQDGRADIVWRHHVSAPVVKAAVTTYRQGVGAISARWSIEGKAQPEGFGWLRVRRNGVLLLDYAGPLGYAQPGVAADYIKRGVYSWVPRVAPLIVDVSA
jgi:hypothetical protein